MGAIGVELREVTPVHPDNEVGGCTRPLVETSPEESSAEDTGKAVSAKVTKVKPTRNCKKKCPKAEETAVLISQVVVSGEDSLGDTAIAAEETKIRPEKPIFVPGTGTEPIEEVVTPDYKGDGSDEPKEAVDSEYERVIPVCPHRPIPEPLFVSIVDRVWVSLQNNTDKPDVLINLAHIPDIPYSKVLDTPDLSQYVTKSVHDLVYYYTKYETYTKAEVDELIQSATDLAAVWESFTTNTDEFASSVIHPDHIPSIAMSKVIGLADALAGKQAVYPFTITGVAGQTYDLSSYTGIDHARDLLDADDLFFKLPDDEGEDITIDDPGTTGIVMWGAESANQVALDVNGTSKFLLKPAAIDGITSSISILAGYFSNGAARNALLLNGHADEYFATSEGLAAKQDIISDLATIRSGAALGATAVQVETDPTVPAWAKASTKPSYVFSEIGSKPTTISGYGITDAYISGGTIRLGNNTITPVTSLAGYATENYVNSRGFITNTVNDLVNYYTKGQTYTQAEIDALIGSITQFHFEIYPTLPATGQSNVLYLIGPQAGTDIYDEYVYSNNAWTKIGSTSIDLSAYVQKTTQVIAGNGLAGGGALSSNVTLNLSSATIASLALADSAYQLPSSGIPLTDLASGIQTSLAYADSAYQKPSTGIPLEDLHDDVQSSLALADSALQSTDLDGYVNAVSPSGTGNYVTSVIKSGKVVTVTYGNVAFADVTGAEDLQAIEALTGTSGLLKKTAANTWTLDTNTYALASDLTAVSGRVTTLESRINWDNYFGIDQTTGAIYVKRIDENTPRDFFSYGGVSAYGIGSGGGGSSIDIDRVWQSLTNNPADPEYANTKIALAHIPDITMSMVTGLSTALAGKQNVYPFTITGTSGAVYDLSDLSSIEYGRDLLDADDMFFKLPDDEGEDVEIDDPGVTGTVLWGSESNSQVQLDVNGTSKWLLKPDAISGIESSVGVILGYFVSGSARNAIKLNGHEDTYFATASSLSDLADTVDGLVTGVSSVAGKSGDVTLAITDITGLQAALASKLEVAVTSLGTKTGAITLGAGLAISNDNVLSVTGQTMGTVTRVDLGSTQYAPDASGVVGLPAYPTTLPASDVYAWAKKASLDVADVPGLPWSKITSGTPTTLSGYGITDANFSSAGVADKIRITLGGNNYHDVLTAHQSLEDYATKTYVNSQGFITKSVSDLTNYYQKGETYSQVEVNNIISGLNLGTASQRGVASVISAGNNNLTPSGLVYSYVNTMLSSVLKWVGETTTDIESNPSANPILIDGDSYTAVAGNVVSLSGTSKEFRFDGSLWKEMGDEASYAYKTISITGTGYLTGGGTLEANRTIDIATNVKSLIDNAVPNTRKVNNHALSADISLDKTDVGLGNVDNLAASGYFTLLTNDNNQVSITVGGTNKKLTVDYAGLAGNASLLENHAASYFATASGLSSVADRVTTLEGWKDTWDDIFGIDNNGDVYVKANGNTPRNFYSLGGVSAYGTNSGGGGGGGIDLARVWESLSTNTDTYGSTKVHIDHIPAIAISGVTGLQTALDGKQAVISDLSTIRSNASDGETAYGWGNHATQGYLKSADLAGYVNMVQASGAGNYVSAVSKAANSNVITVTYGTLPTVITAARDLDDADDLCFVDPEEGVDVEIDDPGTTGTVLWGGESASQVQLDVNGDSKWLLKSTALDGINSSIGVLLGYFSSGSARNALALGGHSADYFATASGLSELETEVSGLVTGVSSVVGQEGDVTVTQIATALTSAGYKLTDTIYTLPIAGASTLGGIKIGTGLSIDGSGVVSVTGQTQGTVTRVDVGSTQYSPDVNGVVGLPAYPTTLPASDVYDWAKAATKPSYTSSEIGLGNVTNDAQVKRTEMGAALGVATLGSDGKIPSSQLPSYVDDVLEYASLSAFPATGESGKIYIALDTNKTYRWSGTTYTEISPSVVIGTTTGTAFDGGSGYSHVTNDDIHVTASQKDSWDAKYDLPITGIPKNQLASAVKTSLGLADTAFQTSSFTKANIQSTLGISNWALEANKPSYTFSEIGSTPTSIDGYGIDDAYIEDHDIHLGNGSITVLAADTVYNLVVKNSAGTTVLTYNPANVSGGELTLNAAMVGVSLGTAGSDYRPLTVGSITQNFLTAHQSLANYVTNTALAAWAGTQNINTLGTITTGVWNGSLISNEFLALNMAWEYERDSAIYDSNDYIHIN